MATDIERLVVSLEANIKKYDTAMQKALGQTNSTMAKIERRTAVAAGSVSKSFASAGVSAAGALKIFAGVASVKGAQAFIDTATRIDNALKVAGLSGAELEKVYQSLFASAQKNAAPLEALVQLYGRASLVQKELGVSTQDLLKFTDNVSTALRVSGRSAQESSGALLQLSQALGSGVVRSQEFNSMLEGALPIVQAAANGILEAGGSVSKLRQLVNEGKVSSAAFFKGFQAGAAMLNQQVAGATMTVSQGFERLQNVMIDAARRLNETTGASQAAGATLDNLALAVERLAGAFGKLAEKAGDSSIVNGIGQLGQAADDLWKNPSFRNLIKFLWDPSGQGKIVNMIGETPFERIAQRAIEIDSKLVMWEEQLADARNTAAHTGLDLDKARVKSIEDRIAALKAENAVLMQRSTDAAKQPLTSPTPDAQKKISLKDNPVSGDKKDGNAGDRDAFERRIAMTQRQIDLMGVEARTIDQTVAARERARVVVELETAARRANEQAGLKNTEVTAKQRDTINSLADAYAKARGQLEQLNGPLASFARESADTGKQLENLAAGSLDRIASDFGDIVAGTKTVDEAFKSMAQSILSELAKIAIKKAILGPLANSIGGIFNFSGGGAPMNILPGFAGGGAPGSRFTGAGGKYQPAGIVHRGEYVFDQDSVRAAGGPRALDALRRGLRGYATGGFADGMVMPRLAASGGRNAQLEVNVYNQSSSAQTETKRNSSGGLDVFIRDAVRGIMLDDASKNGDISRAMSARLTGFGGR